MHGTELVAFRTGERVTLDYLNAYAKPENRVDMCLKYHISNLSYGTNALFIVPQYRIRHAV